MSTAGLEEETNNSNINDKGSSISKEKDVRQISLLDGSVRRTLATATIGFPYNNNNNKGVDDDDDKEQDAIVGGALELPTWIDTACHSSTTNNDDTAVVTTVRDSFDELRDAVAYIVNLFITKLDTELASSSMTAASTNNNEDDTNSLSSTVESAQYNNYIYRQLLERENHLEHFHVYTKKEVGDGQFHQHQQQHQQQQQQQQQLLYTNNERNIENDDSITPTLTTLDYHTDAGFFLAFVPAMDCHTRTIDNSSFHLRSRGHDNDDNLGVTPVFDEHDVIIMMGAAAEHWLHPHPLNDENNVNMDEKWRNKFLAMSHALHLKSGAHRAWYGKMHLLPMSLQQQQDQKQKQSTMTRNKERVFPFQLKDYNAHVPNSPVDGCGIRVENVLDDNTVYEEGGEKNTTLTTNVQSSQRNRQRRRLQHVNSPANCNNITDFFCWYQCLDIPNSSDAEANVKGGQSLYCLDPALLSSSSSVSEATTPCRNGYVHNSNCIGSWQKTDDNVPGYALPYKISTEDNSSNQQESSINTISAVTNNDEYCYGGTSMYMDGFTWQGSACVIYLFRSWVLTTPIKFAFAVVGSLCLGILLEYVLRARRRVYALPPGNRRLLMSTLFYGLQLTMGYFIMLVIMTYSGPLFISTVGGMMIGHVVFNAQDALIKRWKEKDYDGRRDGREEVPEAAVLTASGARSRGVGDRSHTELGSYQNGTTSDQFNTMKSDTEKDIENLSETSATSAGIRRSIADGVTPCCQYTL
jgi:hypothetical protein